MVSKHTKRRSVQRTHDLVHVANRLHKVRDNIDKILQKISADEPYHIDLADLAIKSYAMLQDASKYIRKHSIEGQVKREYNNVRKQNDDSKLQAWLEQNVETLLPHEWRDTPRLPGWGLRNYKPSKRFILRYTREWRGEDPGQA